MQSAATSRERIIEASVELLLWNLENKWDRLHLPKGITKSLSEAHASEQSATERVLLDHGGIETWVAYFRATHGKLHFKGQSSRNATIAAFQELSEDDRILVARRVAAGRPHPSIAAVIKKSSTPRKRRSALKNSLESNARRDLAASSAILTSHANSLPPNASSAVPTSHVNSLPPNASSATPTSYANLLPPNETQNSPTASSFSPNETQSSPTASSFPPNKTQSIPTAIPEIPLSNAVQQIKVLEHASQQGIAEVFNKNLCDAIRGDTVQRDGTTYLKAAVTMSFPLWGIDDCVMTLAIHESKVEDLAKALFNVQIVSARHVRSLVFPGGVRVVLSLPSPELTLKGVRANAIMDVFGPEIYAAVVASNMRGEELAGGVEVPQGVSMILPVSSSDTTVINLTLETFSAVRIRNKIFP